MEIYESVVSSNEPTAVALGFFDGVHSAHARVIKEVCGDPSLCPTVMTFSSAHLLPQKKRELPAFAPLCFLGRHSLADYLLHQPILYGITLLL